MSLNNVKFIKGQGGLGRPLSGKDHISGMIFYGNSSQLIAGKLYTFYSIQDAEKAGVVGDNSDEIQAVLEYTISAIGVNGDTIDLSIVEPNATVSLASYTKSSTENSVTKIATKIVGLINNDTKTHGYSAFNTAGVITLTGRKGLGYYLNGLSLTETITGTLTASTTTPFAAGVASPTALFHYHIKEFFRIQPKGILYFSCYDKTQSTFEEIKTMQLAVNGDIRQIGVYNSNLFAPTQTTTIQTICDELDELKMPLSVIYAPKITDVTTLTDLSIYDNNKVSVVIGQDYGYKGNDLFYALSDSVTIMGATLGAVALSAVNEDIAWVGKFDLSDGNELEKIGFADATTSDSASFLDTLNLYRYIFLRKFPNKAGTFFNDNHCAISVSSDYAYINDNRVIDKVIRGVDTALLPSLNSPLKLNADGTLANSTILYLESQATVVTDDMIRNAEVSAVSVTIDPQQKVLTTSTIYITIDIVPIGVARNIVVNIGYKTSL